MNQHHSPPLLLSEVSGGNLLINLLITVATYLLTILGPLFPNWKYTRIHPFCVTF